MKEIRIKLSALWVVLMLTYLLGDVMRIFSGDFVAGEMSGMESSEMLYLGMAVLMLIPILMVFLNLVLAYKASRWANIVLAAFFFLFNLIGLPMYAFLFDQFLIAVGLVFNLMTIWYAWKWAKPQV